MISQHFFTFPLYIPRVIRVFKNWTEYLGNYLLRRNEPAEYLLRSGTRFIDGAGTLAGTMAVVYLRREYGSPKGDRVIVDVGANMGCFSIFSAEQCKDATIFCYEPGNQNYEMLNNNLSANGLRDRVHTYQVAVAGVRGTKDLIVGESPLNSLIINIQAKCRQPVNCITLSDIIAEHKLSRIDFLKLNCEGSEYEIIENCPDPDITKIKKIRLEYHNLGGVKHNGQYLRELLQSRGFLIERFTKYRNESGFIWASREDQ